MLSLLPGEIYGPEAEGEQCEDEKCRSGVERQVEYIDEQQVEQRGYLRQVGDDAPEHYGQYDR